MKIIKIILCIYGCTAFLYTQDFSIESILNSSHTNGVSDFLKSQYWDGIHGYAKSVFSKKIDSLYNQGKFHNQSLSFIIPDSVAEVYFRIKKGDLVTQLYNGLVVNKDKIECIEAVMDGSGQIYFYFLLNKLKSRNENWYDFWRRNKDTNYYFYVINAKNVKSEKLLYSDLKLYDSLLNKITSVLTREMQKKSSLKTYFELLPQIDEIDTLKYRLKRYCSYQRIDVDIDQDFQVDKFIEFQSKNYKKANFWDFTVIFYSSTENYDLIPFSQFEYAVKINGKTYYMFRLHGPETGMRGRNLFLYDNETQKLKNIFGDWTFSD